jgi:hypothetical protein
MVLGAPSDALRWCAVHPLFFNLLELPDVA